MAKYRKKPVVIEAVQWIQHGDHPNVDVCQGPPNDPCPVGQCESHRGRHGWIHTMEGGYAVCPGDYIITGVKGEHYPCKPDIFAATYDPVASAKEE